MLPRDFAEQTHPGRRRAERFRRQRQNRPRDVHDALGILARVGLRRSGLLPERHKPEPKCHAGVCRMRHLVDGKPAPGWRV